MVYRLLADAVFVVHASFILLVVAGGVAAWRWPRLLWLHAPAVAWSIGIVAVGFACPLTPLERNLHRLGDERGYDGGFVDRYIEDVIYPDEYTPVVRALVAAAVVLGWAGLIVRRQRANRHPGADGRPRRRDPGLPSTEGHEGAAPTPPRRAG